MQTGGQSLSFYNPYQDLRITRDRLPHWEQKGCVYFVTFRLADSLPSKVLKDLETERADWLRRNPEPWTTDKEMDYNRRFSSRIERALDAGHGFCLLRQPECRSLVTEALQHFDGDRYLQLAFVVMPNHIHSLFLQNVAWTLRKIVRSWKSFSARQINAEQQRSLPLWQRDYFDRLIRDQQHFQNCLNYIRGNPEKARLGSADYTLYEHEVVRGMR